MCSQRHCAGMHTSSVFAAAFAASSLFAQTQVVVPAGYADLEATSAARTPFGWSSGRVQYLVAGEQICSSVALITELKFRLDGGNYARRPPVGKTFQCAIDAYEVMVDAGKCRRRERQHRRCACRCAYSTACCRCRRRCGSCRIPTPWSLTIVLDQPLLYSRANGNLMLDLTVTGGSGDNWPADGFFFRTRRAAR